ncbi:uncharacterized protein BKA55DRAFT_542591 [Fusarium redolens]|uniref:Uncharacterized protein n=1 Tax=Fusarium redolens TaxID=48865 RepID=A0A9P9GL64_FUSRE|nr:uncharacterized protein BKA55DRAFT_542591 [Fusarium redolens]KAH7239994.1 hypothetical protein BKA55DRAFT_542591 [Fusarium redolens]
MPFAIAENMIIVGIRGTLTAHERSGVSPFIETMRILQARSDGGERPSEAPVPWPHEGSCWNAANCMFKNIISPHDDLRLKHCKGRVRNNKRWHSLVPLNTLVLADDINQLLQLCLNGWHNYCCDVGNFRIITDVETCYLRDMDDDGSIWPEEWWDMFEIDGLGGEIIEEVIVYHAFYRDPLPKAIEIHTNWGRSVLWGVDMKRGEDKEETNEPAALVSSINQPTYLRADDGYAIVGFVMGCGKVFGRWHSDEYHVERRRTPYCHSPSGRLNSWGEDYIDEEDSRGPWTKGQYNRRNESTIHTGMSKFGIITKRNTDEQENSI